MARTAEWVLIGKWHRADTNSRTLCGEQPVAGVRRSPSFDVARDVKDNKTPVCAGCEGAAPGTDSTSTSGWVSPGAALAQRRLSLAPEQRATLERREAEQVRRRSLQEAADTDRSARRGSSIRTVRGGLPGLGRRR